MKPIYIFFILFLALQVNAQRDYTFVTDRNFFEVEALLGYDFRPYQFEGADRKLRNLSPGEYSFGVTRSILYVEGPNIKGAYQISSINPTEYGFILNTINARDARLTGHLKVILNQYSQAEAVVFRRSPNDPEMIFFMAEIPDKTRKSEAAHFTDWDELALPHPDSIWGKTVRPFFVVHQESGIQQRLQIADSLTIEFTEVITIEEKTKTITVGDSLAQADSTIVLKSKEIREYFVTVSGNLLYDDMLRRESADKYQVKKIVERQYAKPNRNEERYEWELTLSKGGPIYLYLNGKRALTSMKIAGKTYQVRGY
jgi:hypothetical protein